MGCIMTPMPNYLSTHPYYYISIPLNHKTTHKRVGERRAERCGNGADEKDEEDRNIEQHHKNSVGNKRRNQEQTRGEGHVKKKI